MSERKFRSGPVKNRNRPKSGRIPGIQGSAFAGPNQPDASGTKCSGSQLFEEKRHGRISKIGRVMLKDIRELNNLTREGHVKKSWIVGWILIVAFIGLLFGVPAGIDLFTDHHLSQKLITHGTDTTAAMNKAQTDSIIDSDQRIIQNQQQIKQNQATILQRLDSLEHKVLPVVKKKARERL